MAGSDEICKTCRGNGLASTKHPKKLCGTCGGTGRVTVNRRSSAKDQKPEKKKGWW